MKTPEQLKGAIRNIAKDKKLKPQEVLQMFLFEICDEIKQEPAIEKLWMNYQNENQYAADISFKDVVDNLIEVAKYLNN